MRTTHGRCCTPEEAFAIVHARSRDDGRYPMAWDGTPTAGFTSGAPWIALPANHAHINATDEMADPHSVRAYFKRLIELRKELDVIQAGDVRFADTEGDKVIAYERSFGGTRILVQCNFGKDEVPSLDATGGGVLIGNYDEPANGTLRPWEAIAHIWR